MDRLTLTPHQENRLDWIVSRLLDGQPLVALRGLAGCGKSVMIPFLAARLTDAGIPVKVGAPTHRAAMILRKKGVRDADTIHAHALTPYFLPEYAACMRWLGADCPTHDALEDESAPDGPIPPLIAAGLTKHHVYIDTLLKRAQVYPPKRVLESIGIHGRNYFDGFGPKLGEGCLIIDEASMVGTETLALCQRAFPLICLVGDPGQLPPVKEEGVLATVDGIDLTEIHRQAGESPIIQLAYAARQRRAPWHRLPCKAGELEEWMGVKAHEFLTAPLIVWRNKVRVACITSIRHALGYPADMVVPGEPLICRSNNPEDRADGYYNNALFRVMEVSATEPTVAVIQEEGTDTLHNVHLHIEEIHGEAVHPRAVPFRFAYCLTAHMAQGGEWPTVYIAKPELLAFLGVCHARGTHDEGARWSYTAITRAKQALGFVLNYDFTQSVSLLTKSFLSEHTMPRMTATEEQPQHLNGTAPGEALSPDTEPDDIPDPVTPESVTAPSIDPGTPAGQVVMSVDEALYRFSQQAATVLGSVEKSWDAALRILNHNQNATQCLAETLKTYVPCVPFSASVSVTSPAGFPITLSCQDATQEGFLTKMGALMGFLQDNNFTPGAPF